MSRTYYYLATSHPSRYVEVPVDAEQPVRVMEGQLRTGLVSPLRPAALREARAAARRAGLRLRQPDRVGVRFRP